MCIVHCYSATVAGYLLTAEDVATFSAGCAALGSGGGGSVTAAATLLESTLRARPVEVRDIEEVPDRTTIALVGAVGSPTVMLERLPSDREFEVAVHAWESYAGRRLEAVCILEIGGVNGLLGVNTAARLGLPVLDADAMGRALPRLDMTVLAGSSSPTPLVLADARGGRFVLDGIPAAELDAAVRRILPAFGSWAAVCLHGGRLGALQGLVRGSVTRALGIGRALRAGVETANGPRSGGTARPDPADPLEPEFIGTLVEVLRWPDGGGVAALEAHSERWSTLRIDFADEFVLATLDGRLVAQAPDIITLIDARTKETVLVDGLRVGQRVELVVIPAPPELVPRARDLGPAAYGLMPIQSDRVSPATDPAEVGR